MHGDSFVIPKEKLASIRLERTASWEEAIIEYKGYWDEINARKMPKGIENLRKYYQILQEK